jgi:LysM repeat protein
VTNWITRQPTKYWALSLSLLGLGACSSTKGPTDSASDLSYADVPVDQSSSEGGAEGSLSTEIPSLDGAAQVARQGGPAYRNSAFPEIATRAIAKDGYSLNGYVFVRGERSWKDLSRLLYGRDDRATLLSQWNANAEIKPGAVIYYNSPFRPDDTSTLKSFDSDFGMTLSAVSVSAGDTLSSIAAKVYGSPDAWRELAILNANGLTSPDSLEVGQSLQIAPATRDTSAILQAYVQKVQGEAQAALSDPSTTQSEQLAQANPSPSDPELAASEGAQAPPAADDSALEVSSSVGDMSALPIKDIALMLGALAAVAGLVAFYVRRRKKLEASNAANTIFFNSKKTGTED